MRNYVKEVIMGMIEVHAEVSTPFISAVKSARTHPLFPIVLSVEVLEENCKQFRSCMVGCSNSKIRKKIKIPIHTKNALWLSW